jgi:hypothetical protein
VIKFSLTALQDIWQYFQPMDILHDFPNHTDYTGMAITISPLKPTGSLQARSTYRPVQAFSEEELPP